MTGFVCTRQRTQGLFFVSAATKNILTDTIPKTNIKMFQYNHEYNEIQWMTNKSIEGMKNFKANLNSEIAKNIIDKIEQDDYFQGIIKLNQIISKQNPNLN